MESTKEIYESLKDVAIQRIKNPFMGAFLLSWLVFNWKAISYFIFSSQDILTVLSFLENSFYPTWEVFGFDLPSKHFFTIIFPLLVALSYRVGASFIYEKIDSWSETGDTVRENRKSKQNKNRVKLEIVLDDIRKKGREVDELKVNLEKANNDLTNLENKNKGQLVEITSLEQIRDEQHNQIEQLKESNNDLKDQIQLERLIQEVKLSNFGLFNTENGSRGFEYHKRIFDSVLKSPHSNEQLKTMVNEKLRSDSIVLNDDLVMQAYDRIMSIEKENYEALKYFFENFKMIPSFNGRTLETESKVRTKYLEDKSIIYQANEIKTKDSMLRYKITDLGYHVKAMNDVLGMIKANPTNFRSMD